MNEIYKNVLIFIMLLVVSKPTTDDLGVRVLRLAFILTIFVKVVVVVVLPTDSCKKVQRFIIHPL